MTQTLHAKLLDELGKGSWLAGRRLDGKSPTSDFLLFFMNDEEESLLGDIESRYVHKTSTNEPRPGPKCQYNSMSEANSQATATALATAHPSHRNSSQTPYSWSQPPSFGPWSPTPRSGNHSRHKRNRNPHGRPRP